MTCAVCEILYTDKNQLETTFWVLKFRETVWRLGLCLRSYFGSAEHHHRLSSWWEWGCLPPTQETNLPLAQPCDGQL